ncbi:MAG: lysylphosphatidylglycerol synthase transmembrane domain-containing protein [Flavobacteriales bacterium]
MNIRKTIIYLLFLALAAGMMYYLYKDISWEKELKPSLQNARWHWIIISFALGYAATVVRGLRWNLMLEPLGYKAGWWTSIHSVAFGYCMNNLIPRSGELARCTLLNRAEKIPVNKLIGTVILERIVDFMMLGVVMLLAFLVKADALNKLISGNDATAPEGEKSHLLFYLAIAGIVCVAAGWWLLWRLRHKPFFGKIIAFMHGMLDGLKSIFKLKKQFLFWLASLTIWALWLLMAYCSMSALQETEHLTFADTIFFTAAGSLGMIVPTPGGAGAFHGMSVLAFQALGYNGETGRIYALISWSLKTAFDILVGALGFVLVTSKKIKV